MGRLGTTSLIAQTARTQLGPFPLLEWPFHITASEYIVVTRDDLLRSTRVHLRIPVAGHPEQFGYRGPWQQNVEVNSLLFLLALTRAAY